MYFFLMYFYVKLGEPLHGSLQLFLLSSFFQCDRVPAKGLENLKGV